MSIVDCSRFQRGPQEAGGLRRRGDPPRRTRPRRARRARAPGRALFAAMECAAEDLRGAELPLELAVGLDHALVLPARLNRLLERPLHPHLDLATCTLCHVSTSRSEPRARECWCPAPMRVERF